MIWLARLAKVPNLRLGKVQGWLADDSPGHVSGAGQDLVVVQETAARQVARVAGQLPGNSHITFTCLQAKQQTHIHTSVTVT